MIYSIYIPGQHGADKSHLAAVGLADLFRADDAPLICADVLRGPDGGPGQIWTWQEGPNIAAYQPERQGWFPCVPDPVRQLPAGRFWWGFTDGPPSLQDLQRLTLIEGKTVELLGGVAIVPNVLRLPETYGLDDQGNVSRLPRAEFRPFVDDCEWVIQQMLDETAVSDWKRELLVAVRFLNINYRINVELAIRLELLDPGTAVLVQIRAVDPEKLRKVVDLKNSQGGAQTPTGSAVSAGAGG